MQRRARLKNLNELFLRKSVGSQAQLKCTIGTASGVSTDFPDLWQPRVLNGVRDELKDLVSWLLKCKILKTIVASARVKNCLQLHNPFQTGPFFLLACFFRR